MLDLLERTNFSPYAIYVGFGGSGTIFGALIGSLLMSMLNNGLIFRGYQPSDQLTARGLIILVAAVLTAQDPNR
jgi:ribose transport system permease protein